MSLVIPDEAQEALIRLRDAGDDGLAASVGAAGRPTRSLVKAGLAAQADGRVTITAEGQAHLRSLEPGDGEDDPPPAEPPDDSDGPEPDDELVDAEVVEAVEACELLTWDLDVDPTEVVCDGVWRRLTSVVEVTDPEPRIRMIWHEPDPDIPNYWDTEPEAEVQFRPAALGEPDTSTPSQPGTSSGRRFPLFEGRTVYDGSANVAASLDELGAALKLDEEVTLVIRAKVVDVRHVHRAGKPLRRHHVLHAGGEDVHVLDGFLLGRGRALFVEAAEERARSRDEADGAPRLPFDAEMVDRLNREELEARDEDGRRDWTDDDGGPDLGVHVATITFGDDDDVLIRPAGGTGDGDEWADDLDEAYDRLHARFGDDLRTVRAGDEIRVFADDQEELLAEAGADGDAADDDAAEGDEAGDET